MGQDSTVPRAVGKGRTNKDVTRERHRTAWLEQALFVCFFLFENMTFFSCIETIRCVKIHQNIPTIIAKGS